MVHLPDPFGQLQQTVEIVCSIDNTLTIIDANQSFKDHLISPDQPYKEQSAFHFLDLPTETQQELLKSIRTILRHEPIHFHAGLRNGRPGKKTFYWTMRPVIDQENQFSALVITGLEAGRYVGRTPEACHRANAVPNPVQKPAVPEVFNSSLLLDTLFEGVVLFDNSCAIVYANKASESILGLSKATLESSSTWDPRWNAIHEDGTSFEPADHPSAYTLRTGVPCKNVVMGVPRHQAEMTWLSINTQPIYTGGSASPDQVLCTFKDITEQKRSALELISAERLHHEKRRAEEAMQEKDQLFISFLNNIPTPVWISDALNVFRYGNATALHVFGLSGEEAGKPLDSIFPPQLATDYIQTNQAVLQTNKPMIVQERSVDAQGETKILHTSKYPLGQDYDGVPLVSSVAMDITQSINAKEDLRIINERYEYALKATSEVIWDWDIDKNIITLSEASATIFGCPDLHITQETRVGKIHPDDSEKFLQSIQDILHEQKEYWNLEYRIRTAWNEYRVISDNAFIIRDDNMNAVRMIGAMQDVTDQRTLERKLVDEVMTRKREVVKAIIRAQERERKELSHELHDNLCQLLVTSKLYIDVCLNEPDNRHLLQDCRTMLIDAIDETRNLSHSLTPAAFDEKGLFTATRELIAKLNSLGKITIHLNISEEQLEAQMQPDMRTAIYRIIQEQLNNILKHADANSVNISFSKQQDTLQLLVGDDGIGFDINKIKRGLGLNNIISRVSLFAGDIDFVSSPGNGCTMQIRLPLD